MKYTNYELPVHGQALPENHSDVPVTPSNQDGDSMPPPLKANDQAIRNQFIQASNLAFALHDACDTDSKCLPFSKLVELLYPLALKMLELELMCVQTHWSKIVQSINCYLSVLVDVLIDNQTNVSPRNLTVLLSPLLVDFRQVKLAYANLDSNCKAAQATNIKAKVANQNNEECEQTEALPAQDPSISDGLVFATLQDKILELIGACLTGKQGDIWTKYQACLPSDLTPDEVKTAKDSFMVMLKEHFI